MTGPNESGKGDAPSGEWGAIYEEFRKRVRSNRIEVPSLPHVGAEIMRLAMRDDTTFAQLETTVRMDQFLAAKIVGMANSALFARSSIQTANLRGAMSRIGLRGVRDLAMAYSLSNKIFTSRGNAALIRSIWLHSLATAIVAEMLAREVGDGAEYAFMAGLVHNIGAPVIVKAFDEMADKNPSLARGGEGLLRQLIHDLHTEVGGFIAKRWNLPDPLSFIVSEHHDDNPPADPEHYPVHLIRAAIRLAGTLEPVPPEDDAADGMADPLGILELYAGRERVERLRREWPGMKDLAEATLSAMM